MAICSFTPLKDHSDWVPYLWVALLESSVELRGFFFDGGIHSIPDDIDDPRGICFELPTSSEEDLKLYLELWGHDLIKRIREGSSLHSGGKERRLDAYAQEAERQLRRELLELPIRFRPTPAAEYFAIYPLLPDRLMHLNWESLGNLAEQMVEEALQRPLGDTYPILDASDVLQYLISHCESYRC